MATTSTAAVVLPALHTALKSALPVSVWEAWPGPDAEREMLVLGQVEWDGYEIATIKSGRKHRQETYSIGYEIFVFGAPGSKPTNPGPARARAFEISGRAEDVLADDPTLGLPTGTVQRIEITPTEAGPHVFEKGWAYRAAGRFHVHARLI